jgi:hypothetical protein
MRRRVGGKRLIVSNTDEVQVGGGDMRTRKRVFAARQTPPPLECTAEVHPMRSYPQTAAPDPLATSVLSSIKSSIKCN